MTEDAFWGPIGEPVSVGDGGDLQDAGDPRVRLGSMRFTLLFAALVGCSRGSAEDHAPLPPPPAEPSVAECAAGRNPNCLRPDPPKYEFAAVYADSACKRPVASRTTYACQVVQTSGTIEILAIEALGAHRSGDTVHASIVEQVGGDALFVKKGGICKALPASTDKNTPSGCDGQRVCRNGRGELACAGCRVVPVTNGCPDWEGSRTRVVFTEE